MEFGKPPETSLHSFTDDDCVPDSHWVANISAAFAADSTLGLVGSRVELFNIHDHPTTTRTSREQRLLSSPSNVFSLIIGCNQRKYARGRGSFFAKHMVKGDRLVLKMAYWEVRSTLVSLAKNLLRGKAVREEWKFLSSLFAGAVTRFTK